MRTRAMAVTAALALGLAACSGGGAEEPDTTETQAAAAEGAVTFVGTENLQWEDDTAEATLVDGALEVTIECQGAVPHNVAFEGVQDDAVIAECSGDDSDTGTVELEPGTYTYYCAVPGHREAGMEGEITVS